MFWNQLVQLKMNAWKQWMSVNFWINKSIKLHYSNTYNKKGAITYKIQRQILCHMSQTHHQANKSTLIFVHSAKYLLLTIKRNTFLQCWWDKQCCPWIGFIILIPLWQRIGIGAINISQSIAGIDLSSHMMLSRPPIILRF